MAIRVSVEVDEDRLEEAGMAASDEDIIAQINAMAAPGSRLRLQSRDHWPPVRNLRLRRLADRTKPVG